MSIYLILILLCVFFAVLPLCLLFVLKSEKHLKLAYIILLILYVIILCTGVFTDIKVRKVVTIEPYFIPPNAEKFFNFKFVTHNKKDILLNLSMFVPFGFFIAGLFNKFRVLKTFSIGVVSSIFIESVQYFLPTVRTAQLTDIILNSISCLIGAILFVLFFCLKKKVHKKKTT